MIRVIVERHLKSGQDLGKLLLDLHMIAVQFKGHVSNEMLMEVGRKRVVTISTTWHSIEDWNAWESSKERREILKKIEPLLSEKEKIKKYDIISVADLDFYIDPEYWYLEHEHPHFEG